MSFPPMHGYDRIDLVADLDPVAAVRDRELGERIREFPKLFPAGSPDFGFAVQSGTSWRIGSVGTSDPESARRSLAAHLRRTVTEQHPAPDLARAMMEAAGRMDPEVGGLAKDEWEIGERRYRVIRIERFTLIGGGAMEPPRSTDTDPGGPKLLRDHPVEPLAPAGHWETQLRLNLAGFRPIPGTVPEIVQTEAVHAIQSHPGVILLPPTFTVVEIKEDGSWQPFSGGDGPGEARGNLAAHFTQLMPLFRRHQGDPPSDAELAEWERAAEQITATDGYEFAALGRSFRTVRISRMMRLGRDGPEGPRPSDQERYGEPAIR
ncbi:DUF5954 family protein [Spirillospora sp. NPDC047418]